MLDTDNLSWAIARWFGAREQLCDRLNAADSKLGDGDTGMTVKLIIESLQNSSAALSDDLGAAIKACAQECARTSGSSLGTIIAMGLSGAARLTNGQTCASPGNVADMISAAIDRITERSGSALGDKTILDSLDRIRVSVAQLDDPEQLLACAFSESKESLLEFQNRACLVGRARVYGEKTMGIDDPGMLAVFLLLEILAENE